jgi:hypothetical protein
MAFWARQAMFVSIPLVGAFVAEHHIPARGLLILWWRILITRHGREGGVV